MKSVKATLIIFLLTININFAQKEEIGYAELKRDAFLVLSNKCNSCHSTKKRTEIFTLENMDSLASTINTQVFVKKKMPKGKNVKLTENEMKNLIEWLHVALNSE